MYVYIFKENKKTSTLLGKTIDRAWLISFPVTSDRSYKQNMKRSCWWKKSSYLSTYVGTCLANVLLYLLWCFPLNYVNFKWLKIRISMLLNPLKDKEIWHYFSKKHVWLGSWLKSFKDPSYSLMTEVKGFFAYIWISVIFGTL